VNSNVVLTADHLRRVVAHFLKQPAFSFDVESVGEYRGVPALNQVTWLSMATYGMCVAIPMGHPVGTRQVGTAKEPRTDKNGKVKYFTVPVYEDPPEQLSPAEVFKIVRPLFFCPNITKVAHEATFDLGSTAKYWGEICCGPYDDTKVIMRLVDENTASKDNGLKAWTLRQYGVKYDNENVGRRVEIHPFGKVAHYSYMDALYTWLLWLRNRPRIAAEKLTFIHDEIERPLIHPLTAMRLAGITMDNERLLATQDELTKRLVVEEGEVYRCAGQRFNLNSPPQKTKVLFDPVADGGQGLKPWKFSDKTGAPSTDADVLKSYPTNPVCHALLEYAATHTLLSTYLNAWLGVEGDAKKEGKIVDGILYTEFQQHGTVTGRFSGRSPNLQNIPRPDKPDGLLIRGSFTAPPAHKLVVADYGQIELVVLAHLIGRGKLYEGFMAGVDPHTTHAAAVLKKKPFIGPGGITKDERQKYGKTLGFTIVNGAGWKTIAETGGFTEKQAKQVQKDYGKEFPEVDQFRQAMIRWAKDRTGTPYVRSLLGRKRRLPGLYSSDNGMRMYAERQLFNFLIQGGAADLMKLALIRADAMIREQVPQAWLSLTVHDEIVAVCPDEFAEKCQEVIVEAMTGAEIQKLISVPLTVDAHIVERWSAAK
jgi:DNA polymerase I-like protein with 3'-5' exonuclease and polymerase domains